MSRYHNCLLKRNESYCHLADKGLRVSGLSGLDRSELVSIRHPASPSPSLLPKIEWRIGHGYDWPTMDRHCLRVAGA